MKTDILFDLDGTLTDPAEGITNSVRHAMRRLAYTPEPGLDLTRFIGPPLDEGFSQYCGFEPGKIEQAVVYFREYFSERGIEENLMFPGIPALLEELVANGRRLHLATSKPITFARRILDRFELTPYFTHFSGSPIDHYGTPKAEVVREALQKGNIEPQNAVMVGDRSHDIVGAKKNGILSIGVLYGYGDRAEHEAAGADHIAGDIPALRALLLNPAL